MAAHGCSLRRSCAGSREHGQVGVPLHRRVVAVRLGGREAVRAGANLRRDANGNDVVVRSTSLPPVHVTEEPLTSALQPGGEEAESIEIPGGAFTERETVSLGGRSFGRLERDLGLDPVLDERRLDGDVGVGRSGNDERHCGGDESFLTAARGAVRSPSAGPRWCPHRSRGSSGRGRAGRLRTRR